MTGRDIVILSVRNDESAAASNIKSQGWRDRIRPYSQGETGGYIRYCSIHAFKGLEAPAIIVTDIEDIGGPPLESLIYVGVTRSLHRLIIIMQESMKSAFLSGVAR